MLYKSKEDKKRELTVFSGFNIQSLYYTNPKKKSKFQKVGTKCQNIRYIIILEHTFSLWLHSSLKGFCIQKKTGHQAHFKPVSNKQTLSFQVTSASSILLKKM